jgi:hypothetical protein
MEIKTIKELRIGIDTCINSIKLLSPSREVSLAQTNLQRSKMWLGQVLRVSGEVNPYPKSDDPSSSVIEKQAEHTDKTFSESRDGWASVKDQTAKVKFFRSEMEILLIGMEQIRRQIASKTVCGGWGEAENKRWTVLFFEQAHLALIEAKMWLGNELNNQREK